MGVALLLNKPEFPLPKDAVCQVCLNLLIGSSKEEVQMSSMYFRHFVKKGDSFEQTLIPFTEESFVALHLNQLIFL